MVTYQIKEAFYLKSFGKLLCPPEYFQTEDEAQIAELKKFEADGSCKELVKEKPKAVEAPVEVVMPVDDITVVPGVGKKVQEKLEKAGIVTLTAFKAAMNDVARTEELKELLGKNYDKAKTFSEQN